VSAEQLITVRMIEKLNSFVTDNVCDNHYPHIRLLLVFGFFAPLSVRSLACSPLGSFAPWLIRLLACLPSGLFTKLSFL